MATDAARARLKAVVFTKQPLALVGAGLSASLGYPLWNNLLDLMESAVATRYPEIASMKSQTDQLWRAEEYKRLLSEAYFDFIKDTFGRKTSMKSPALDCLVRAPFGHILTSNYDPCLDEAHSRAFPEEGARVIRFEESGLFRDFLHRLGSRTAPKERTYVHLHGRFDHPDEIVLTESDYTNRYFRSDSASRKLFAIFATQPVVFVGFGLGDPDFMQLLREVQLVVGGGTPRHFAILARPKENADFARRRLVEKFGIEPVFYEPSADHSGLLEVLRELSGAAPSPERDERVVLDPTDSNKGMFGGEPETAGRRLTALVADSAEVSGWYDVTLTVEGTAGGPALQGTVDFYLHQTFTKRVRTVHVRAGRATLELRAWGAFTVGVMTDGGKTKLELDLSSVSDAPHKFLIS